MLKEWEEATKQESFSLPNQLKKLNLHKEQRA